MEQTIEWKASPVFPNEYLVSSDGRVFSQRSNKKIRPAHDKFGYLYYVLCVDGKRVTVKAHRLVALAYLPNPKNKPTVDHINGIRHDNRVENLRWATSKEQTNNPNTLPNLLKALGERDMRAMGEKRNWGRKPVTITWENGEKQRFPSLLSAANSVGINCGHLSEILNGKRKQRGGFTISV